MLNASARRLLSDNKLLLIIAALCLFMLVYDRSFFSFGNIRSMLENVSIIGILAVGMTLLMISRAFDLSIGSIMVLSGVISIKCVNAYNPQSAIIIGVLSGLGLGLVNGVLVARLKINSFIATIGTMIIYQGIAFSITDMQPIAADSTAFQKFATREILGITASILYFILIAVTLHSITTRTKWGKYAHAIGGSEDACRRLGINVGSHMILYFMISGVCASFAGVLFSSKILAASAVYEENVALLVIAGIVLGGVHLSGGVGRVSGVVQGILLLGLIEQITPYLGLFGYYQLFLKSMLLLGIVVYDVVSVKRLADVMTRFALNRAA